MKQIKIFTLALALSFVGAMYAAGTYAQSTAQESDKNQTNASCCTNGASCCKDGANCCANHNSNHKKHSNQPSASSDSKKSCCTSNASCCDASCCAKDKTDSKQTAEQACAMDGKGGAGCCKEGASCCAGGSCSTTAKQ